MPESQFGHPHNDLEGAGWPDPDPLLTTDALIVDDVSQMSATPIQQILFPRTETEVESILHSSLLKGSRVGIRGTQHSMGGHAACRNGLLVDTKYLARMKYNWEANTVSVQSGCRWSDVIQFLNRFGKSVRTMQSYASFSVGGTLAVNAHGITSDSTLASDVVSFRLVRYQTQNDESGSGYSSVSSVDKRKTNVVTSICTPPLISAENDTTESTSISMAEEQELFGLVLGGYGLFGIVTEVTLRVSDNSVLTMDSLHLKVSPTSPTIAPRSIHNAGDNMSLERSHEMESEFVRIWGACQAPQSCVEVKLARLNIHTLEDASLYIFRRDSTISTENGAIMTPNLSWKPKELSKFSQLLYKWALPALRKHRARSEARSGQAVDMRRKSVEVITKNELLYESATPLTKLYSPLVIVTDTFVLQEYFVPKSKFQSWINAAKPIFADIEAFSGKGSNPSESAQLMLLNTTIRFVEYDRYSFLKYANAKEGMFAFVLYFRVLKTEEADRCLGEFHKRLCDETLRLSGTFYLPYRKVYSIDQFIMAYPMSKGFTRAKERFDPLGIFSNEWFEKYLLCFCSTKYRQRWNETVPIAATITPSTPNECTHQTTSHSSRRSNSFRALVADSRQKREFEEQFLSLIFNIENPGAVMRIITKACWDPANENDMAIYTILLKHFQSTQTGYFAERAAKGWRSIKQLCDQKRDLTRETAMILHRLGRHGRVRGYVSIGDHGKIVLNLHRAGVLAPCVGEDGHKLYVVHNFKSDDYVPTLSCILERGSMRSVGQQVSYDYVHDNSEEKLRCIPTASVDLVTLNQGLHHFPPTRVQAFLDQVKRVLRKDGLFLVREHNLDASEVDSTSRDNWAARVEMLDMAHMIFNAITGVEPETEEIEIRAFRPLSEWIQLLTEAGFDYAHVDVVEHGDPTHDFMMCFMKVEDLKEVQHDHQSNQVVDAIELKSTEPPIAQTIRALLSQIPSSTVSSLSFLIDCLCDSIPWLVDKITANVVPDLLLEEEMKSFLILARTKLVSLLEDLLQILKDVRQLMRGTTVRETVDLLGLLSMPELFLLLPALKHRSIHLPAQCSKAELHFIKIVEKYFPALFETETNSEGPLNSVSGEKKGGKYAQTVPPPTKHEGPSSEEVLGVIKHTIHAIPCLSNPEEWLPLSGFTLTQQAALLRFFDAVDEHQLALKIAEIADREAWETIVLALFGTGGASTAVSESQTVLALGHLPTKERLFRKELNSPWRDILKGLLSSQHVDLTRSLKTSLKFIGLQDLISLYEEAKVHRSSRSMNNSSRSLLAGRSAEEVRTLLSQTLRAHPVKHVKLVFEEGIRRHELKDVGEILSAEFGYISLTSRLTDITDDLQRIHNVVHRQSRVSPPGSAQERRKPGWLPLDEDVLSGFRNKERKAQALDRIRKGVVGLGTFGASGANVLRLSYRPINAKVDDFDVAVCEEICSILSLKKIGQNIHDSDDNVVWFKLAEWLLVDIIGKVGTSLDHTPWYFFPFMEQVQLYFRVLFQECEIVATQSGFMKAYASKEFLTDLIPGIVIAFVFGQLQALSTPLAQLFPMSLDDAMVESVLFYAIIPTDEKATDYFKREIDPRIHSVDLLVASGESTSKAVFQASLPTYKAMTDILIKLGERIPSSCILSISGLKIMQVRVSLNTENLPKPHPTIMENVIRNLTNLTGVSVLFHYQFPNTDHLERLRTGKERESRVHFALKVHAVSLLPLVRTVARTKDLQIEQIYEIWNGW